jgi:transcriptional regulator with XRE-family HTH domain
LSFTLQAPKPSNNRAIEECVTLGDHLRRKRLEGNESQSCIAHLTGVKTDTITNWELNRHEPMIQYIPKILAYLGYTPLFDLAGTTCSKKLKQFMYVNGLTQKECAMKLDIDPTTIRKILEERKVNQKTIFKIFNRIS